MNIGPLRTQPVACFCLATGGLLGFTVAEAGAELLFQESFNYEAGGSLHGKAGGAGFDRTDIEYVGWKSSDDNQLIQGSLAYAGVQSSGHKVLSTAQGEQTEFRAERYLARPISETDPNTQFLWVSYLFQKDAAADRADKFGMRLHPQQSHPTNRLVFFGDQAETTAGPNNYGIEGSVQSSGGGAEPQIKASTDPAKSGEVTIGVTNFVVGRLTFNPQGTETFDLFINPAPGVVPTTPDASLSGFNLASVYYITFFGGNDVVIDDPSLSVIYQIDEIRGGTTYFDVVPEPSTALSLMLGFGLLVSRRRRSGVIGS